MKHTIKIGFSREPPDGGIVSCKKISLREKFLRILFGEKRRLTILVPGDNVKSLPIYEEGADPDGKNE